MFSFAGKKIFAAVLAFLWGMAFIILFRYALNSLYPFWAVQISLSLFAYLLLSIAWFSFWWYFHKYKVSAKKPIWFFLLAVCNSISFLWIIYAYSENKYLYGMPFLFSAQIFFQFYVISSKLPFFLAQRVYLIAGLVVGFLPIPQILNPFVIFPLTILLSFFPTTLPKAHMIDLSLNNSRLLPLRQSLDFLRFLFIAFAFFGILDTWRSRFYPIVGILTLAIILQALIQKLHHKKEHIKYGVMVLPVLFLLMGISWLHLPFSYWCVMGYTMLAVWESVYFRKTVEGYLNREQSLAGIALLFSIFAYFITYEWSILLVGLLTMLAFLRITAYISRSYRKVITVMYFLVLISWSFITYEKYKQSFTRDFFAVSQSSKVKNEFFPVEILAHFNEFALVKTNVIPQEAIKALSDITKKPALKHAHIPAVFLTFFLEVENIFRDADTAHILNTKFLGAYSESYGYARLCKYLQMRNFSHIYLFPGKAPYDGWLPPVLFEFGHENKIWQIYHPVSGRILALPSDKHIEKNIAVSWFENLGYFYRIRGDFISSLLYFEKRKALAALEMNTLRDMAAVAGSAGKTSRQAELLSEYVKQYDGKQNVLSEKKLLMELLFLERKNSESAQIARELIKEDPERTLSYYRWLYKVFSNPVKTSELRKLYSDLRFWKPPIEDQARKKEVLLSSIADTLAANPEYFQRFNQETKRQEFIIFPE